MSELKEVMNVMQVSGESIPSGYYKKSEADKVIAELERKVDLNKRARQYWRKECILEFKENRHNKYKRCLAMARWCVGKYENYSLLANEAYQRGCYKSEARWDRQADKWLSRKSRWLELAEKFKPNKEAK